MTIFTIYTRAYINIYEYLLLFHFCLKHGICWNESIKNYLYKQIEQYRRLFLPLSNFLNKKTGFLSERRVFKHKIMYGVAGAWYLSPRWSSVDSCMKMFDSQQLLIFKYFFEPYWEFLMVSLCKSNKLAPLFALAKLAS